MEAILNIVSHRKILDSWPVHGIVFKASLDEFGNLPHCKI